MKILTTLFVTLSITTVFAGTDKDKKEKPINKNNIKLEEAFDDANARQEWELKMLCDPTTGKLPPHIHERELAFSKTLPNDANGDKSIGTFHWTERGPWNVGGMTRACAIDVTNENTIIAGTNSGGIWRSTDAGQNWTQVTPKNDYHGVTCIVQDKRPGHTNNWYFGSGDPYCSASGGKAFYSGNGIYKSTDNGITWNKLATTAPNTPQSFDSNWDVNYRLAIDNHDTTHDVVYAAVYGAVYKTMDGGATNWTLLKGSISGSQSYYSNVEVSATGVAYLTLSSDGPGKGIWRSPDGITFTKINPPNFPTTYNRFVSAITPSNENVVYFLGETPGFGEVDTNFLGTLGYKSLWKYTYLSGNGDSAGGVWEDLSLNLPHTGGIFNKLATQTSYDIIIKVKPDNPNVVFIGGTDLYRSDNAFANDSMTTYIGGYLQGASLPVVLEYANHHPDQHEILFYPSDPNKMLNSNDGGIFRTTNCMADTMVWTSLDNGYITSMFYTCAIDHATPGNNIVVGGAQDNGSWFTNDTNVTTPWVTPRGGDGSWCAIADNRTDYYLSIQQGKTMKCHIDNNGNVGTFARIDPLGGKGYEFINPFTLDPNNNQNILYMAGGKYLWRNDNLAGIPMINNWDSITTNWTVWPDSVPTASATITALSISKTPANRLYYGTSNKKVYRIDNANTGTPTPVEVTSLSAVNAFPPSGYANCIAIDPDNADNVMLVFSNYSAVSVFYSTNGGARWRKVGGNLDVGASAPSIRWAIIAHPPNGGTAWFLGTSVGLYATKQLDSTNTVWTQIGTNDIGSIVVPMMDYRSSDGLLMVATHSHGMYSTYFTDTAQVPMAIVFQQHNNFDLRSYPNPTNGKTTIEFNLNKQQKVTIKIYDEMGRDVKTLTDKIYPEGKQTIVFDTTNLPKGVYYYNVLTAENSQTKSIIVN